MSPINGYLRVTEVLSDVGLAIQYPDTPAMALARRRGSLVHLGCQYIDAGTLDWNDVDPRLLPFLRAFEEWKMLFPSEVIFAERRFYSHELGVTGQPDFVRRFPAGERNLIDIKTGVNYDPVVVVQLAVYDHLILHGESPEGNEGLDGIDGHAVLLLCPNGAFKYVPFEREQIEEGWMDFVAAMRIMRRRQQYGR